jgi:DNA-directed RNA polymerase specialized sigma54-like protein
MLPEFVCEAIPCPSGDEDEPTFPEAGATTDTTNGDGEAIKQRLLDIIKNEDKRYPLSDEDLVVQLNQAGFSVARQGVTKYRKTLNIPSAAQRKDWTLGDKQ